MEMQSSTQQSRMSVGKRADPRRESSTTSRSSQSHGSPLRPLSDNNAPSPTDTSKSFAFPPVSISPRQAQAQGPAQRASLVIRQRRSSPLLHEIQGPSRRLSAHQMLLLTPFGGALPEAVVSSGPPGKMMRGSSSMGGPHSGRSASFGMTSIPSSTGMGRDDPGAARGLPSLSSRFNARHQSLVQPVNPSPLSQPMATIQSASDYGSESDSSSLAISRENSSSSGDGDEDDEEMYRAMERERIETARRVNAAAVAMMRSNSLPVLTQRELDAMQDKDGELGIARGAHWAWVQDDADDIQMDSPVPRTTPPARPFAFQDPFAPSFGTPPLAQPQSQSPHYTAPTSTSSDYHYSPTAEPRRMSEVNPSWPHNTSPGSQTVTQSRGTSVATITLSTSPTSPQGDDTPSPPFPGSFNSRASMSALEQTPLLPMGALETLAPIRPRILRYKTSPARFTGLGLHLVVKSQTPSSGSNSSGSGPPNSRRRSSGIDHDRRRSSGNSVSSNEGRRATGTWAVVDVVDKLSSTSTLPSITTTTNASASSSFHSVRTADSSRSSMPNPVYTVEHISARSGSMAMARGSDKFKSLPSRRGKLPPSASAFAYEPISPMGMGMFADPLAFPRRGSLAVLSQTALGPWASPSASIVESGEELLGAPKGNWQDRRGSWAEGWSNTNTAAR